MKKWRESIRNMYKNSSLPIVFLLAAIGTYGIGYVASLTAENLFSFGIISVAVFVGLFVLLKGTMDNLKEIKDKKERCQRLVFAILFSWFFAVCLIMGYQLKSLGWTESGFKGKGLILLRGLALSAAIFPFVNYLFSLLEKLRNRALTEPKGKLWKNRNVFLITWGVVFACWIPVFLAYYPAIMAYDFHRQSQEAVRGFIWFNSYQPLAHTWLIWLFLNIGKLLGGYEIGMAFYSIFQMLVLSVACAYACVVVYRLVKWKWPIVLMTLFFGAFPFISVLSVGVTKDVIFSALFLVFMCLFIERQFLSDKKKQNIIDILWVAEGIVMMLFRNNAVYAVAAFAVVYLIFGAKKQKIRLLIICILMVVGGKGALEGLQFGLGTSIRGSKLEMYNVPVQQMARVGYYHSEDMDAEIHDLLDTYIPEELWEKYNPPLGDTVRWVLTPTYEETWKDNMGDVLAAWAKIGLEYPNEYIDAFLLLNAGYWFFDDVTWAEVFGIGIDEQTGALSTYTSSVSEVIPDGIAHESKFPILENILAEIVNANLFYEWPVVSTLFKMATYCWAMLFLLLACIYIKDRNKAMVVLCPTIYLATMFLGPVVQTRYVLPIIMVVPLLAALLAYKKSEPVGEAETVLEPAKEN